MTSGPARTLAQALVGLLLAAAGSVLAQGDAKRGEYLANAGGCEIRFGPVTDVPDAVLKWSRERKHRE